MRSPGNNLTVEAKVKSTENRIKGKSLIHRGARQIPLNFSYNIRVRDHLKKLEGVKWTRIHKCFYIKDTVENRRRLINHCRGFGWVDRIEFDRVLPERKKAKEIKLPEGMSKEEVACILKCTGNKKNQTLLALIYSSGLRIGELKLKWPDIRRGEKLIYIRGGNGQKDRRLPLSEILVKLLETCACGIQTGGECFRGVKRWDIQFGKCSEILKRSIKAAGIDRKITLHTLRHSYATHLLESGVGLRYIQEILGHANPKTTMLYTHISGKRLGEVRSPIEDLDI